MNHKLIQPKFSLLVPAMKNLDTSNINVNNFQHPINYDEFWRTHPAFADTFKPLVATETKQVHYRNAHPYMCTCYQCSPIREPKTVSVSCDIEQERPLNEKEGRSRMVYQQVTRGTCGFSCCPKAYKRVSAKSVPLRFEPVAPTKWFWSEVIFPSDPRHLGMEQVPSNVDGIADENDEPLLYSEYIDYSRLNDVKGRYGVFQIFQSRPAVLSSGMKRRLGVAEKVPCRNKRYRYCVIDAEVGCINCGKGKEGQQ